MKKIMLLPMLFLFSMWSYGQYSFPAIPGPINVPGTTTINVPINDAANSAGVPAIAYDSFTVSVDWMNGYNAYSSEADLTVNTVGGSVKIDPPTSGGATNDNFTTLTFSGDFTSIYNPSIDGTLSIDLNQSWSSSNADWSNIVVTLFPAPTCPAPTTLSTTGITTTSADISWTAGFSETNWNISWGTPGYTPGDTDEIGTASASMTSYQISGLAPQTTYDMYVQADCGGGDESTWTGPLSLALPTVDNASAVTHQMAMDVIGNISPGATIEFGYLTNATDASSFISISSIVTNSTAVTQEFVTIPVGMPTGDVVFAIYAPGVTSSLIDNVRWEPIPSCPAPTALILDSVTATTADISWTAGFSETNWNISWGTPGFTPGDSDELGTASASLTSYQIAGLTTNTSYDVYVQADCGSGDTSTWVGPYSFATKLLVAPPHTEGFATTTTPVGWNTSGWSIGSTRGVTGNPGNNIYKNIWSTGSSGASFTSVAVGPVTNDMVFSFDYIVASFSSSTSYAPPAAGSGNFVLEVSLDFGETFNVVETVVNNGVAGWQSKMYPLTGFAGQNLMFRITGNWVSEDYDMAFDNFAVQVPPTCLAPTTLILDSVTTTTADISWTVGDTETNWNISWGIPGYTPGDTDEIGTASASMTSYQITGLASQTPYDVYVQADCGSGDISTWVGPYSFATKLLVAPPHTEGFATATTPVGWNTSGWSIGSTRGVTGNPGNNIYKNIYSAFTSGSSFTSVAVGPVTNDMVFSFDYIVAGYYSPYAPPSLRFRKFCFGSFT